MSRRHSLVALLCCAILAAGLTIWGPARGLIPAPREAPVFALVLAGCLWLAWRALQRHRAIAAAATGPYAMRYSGLAIALVIWSALTYRLVLDATGPRASLEMRVWFFLTSGGVSLPITLWCGTLWKRTIGSAVGPRQK